MPTPPTGCLCRQCPPSEQNVKATSAGVSRVAAQGAVRACCPRLIGGGNRHGVRSRNPRVRLRAGEPVLRAGRACPDQHGGRICEQFAAEGAGTPAGAGYPRGRLLAGSAGASALLVVYGGLNVILGALVLSGVIHPAGSVDRTPLRWHVGVWDLWFLVWGSCWRWLPPASDAGR